MYYDDVLCKQMYDYAQLYVKVYNADQICGMKQDYVAKCAMMMYYAGICIIIHRYIRWRMMMTECDIKQDYAAQFIMMMYYVQKCMIMQSYIRWCMMLMKYVV